MDLEINKGIGRNVEFKGLESQYLFLFCGGLLAVFVVFVILYMAGMNQWVCISFGYAPGMAHLPAERPLRHARTDEGSRPQAASEVRAEPPEIPPIIYCQRQKV